MQSSLPLRPRFLGVPEKAGRRHSRETNRRICLQVIAEQGTTSRAEVSRLTSLTRATVSSIVADLIEDGLVQEVGVGSSAGGKPPTLIELNASGRSIVVLDLSCRPFFGAVTDLRGSVLARVEAAEPGEAQEQSVESVLDLACELISRAPSQVLGIGVATPGIINERGSILQAANLGWRDVDLADRLKERVEVPVLVTNDSHAAAVAAQRGLASRNHEVLLINISGGVGAGIILDGLLHLGTHRAAGEIGHVVVDANGEPCGCGNRGCLETVASAPIIWRNAVGRDAPRGNELAWDFDSLADLVGPAAAAKALAEAGKAVGEVAASLVNALDISQVVLWTRIKNAADLLTTSVSSTLVPRVLPAMRADLTITASDDTDLLISGAVAMVLSKELDLVL